MSLGLRHLRQSSAPSIGCRSLCMLSCAWAACLYTKQRALNHQGSFRVQQTLQIVCLPTGVFCRIYAVVTEGFQSALHHQDAH